MPEQRIYLACPYTHTDAEVRRKRFIAVTRCAAHLMESGVLVYSPITHGHAMSEWTMLPGDWAFWQRHCLSFLYEWATELRILRLPGWHTSVGVRREIEAANAWGLPVTVCDPCRCADYDTK